MESFLGYESLDKPLFISKKNLTPHRRLIEKVEERLEK
jgi:hypothetical protein